MLRAGDAHHPGQHAAPPVQDLTQRWKSAPGGHFPPLSWISRPVIACGVRIVGRTRVDRKQGDRDKATRRVWALLDRVARAVTYRHCRYRAADRRTARPVGSRPVAHPAAPHARPAGRDLPAPRLRRPRPGGMGLVAPVDRYARTHERPGSPLRQGPRAPRLTTLTPLRRPRRCSGWRSTATDHPLWT